MWRDPAPLLHVKKWLFFHCFKLFLLAIWLLGTFMLFSRKSDSRIANVCPSVCPSQKPLSLSKSSLSAIMLIYWSLRYLSAIMPITYWLSDLLSRLLSHFGLFEVINDLNEAMTISVLYLINCLITIPGLPPSSCHDSINLQKFSRAPLISLLGCFPGNSCH